MGGEHKGKKGNKGPGQKTWKVPKQGSNSRSRSRNPVERSLALVRDTSLGEDITYPVVFARRTALGSGMGLGCLLLLWPGQGHKHGVLQPSETARRGRVPATTFSLARSIGPSCQ
ncbi:hypothetical protein HAX54_037962, partial [Datura stramonium]|nr:hypothetical protein [Datura stramonium]